MGNRTESRIILAFETAVRGGSICLLDGHIVLASRYGSGDVSRAEDLLANIAELCESSGIDKSQIDVIAVTRGPGSYTGIRIGIATAMGLARALDCECLGVELLNSMAFARGCGGRIISAVPFGRYDAVWQEFVVEDGISAISGAAVDTLDGFIGRIAAKSDCHLVVYKELYPAVSKARQDAAIVEDLAWSIGIAAENGLGSSDLTPVYVRSPAAAGKF